MPKFKHLDLFSGIGGFALAASWVWGADHEIMSFCEIDSFAQKVLKKHWPDVPIHNDIRSYKHDGANINLLTGGFPCQPFSQAGKRKGTDDDRYLWPEMLRVIQETRPEWIIGENVYGVLNIEGGLVFEQMLSDLENSGYEVQPFIIPACGQNAPHKRDRVWIVANSKSDNNREQNGELDTSWTNVEEWGNKIRSESFGLCKTMADTDMPGCKKQRVTKSDETEQPAPQCGSWWETEPSVGRVANGIPSTLHETIKDYGYENADYKKAIAEIDTIRGKILREMWQEQCKTKPSPLRFKSRYCNYFMHKMPYQRTHDKWKLGERIKKESDLQDMWTRICSTRFSQTQDLQSKMLERIREIERNEKVASSRVDRLKGLGNAIVPQVVVPIMQAIKDIEDYK